MDKKKAWFIVGGLSAPSKMPTFGYSLSPALCKTGSKLRLQEGTVCSKCYALKGNYIYTNPQKAFARRAKAIRDRRWIEAMVTLIKDMDYFRWHDAGDLQGIWHLDKIALIAKKTPNTKHWLPTKEKKLVKRYLTKHRIPDNLCIRISSEKIGTYYLRSPFPTSSVGADYGHLCHATRDEIGKCGKCRACWNKGIKNIDYALH